MAKNPVTFIKNSLKKMVGESTIPLKEQLAYAGGTFGNSMGQDLVGTFLTLFMAKYMGIEMVWITALTVVAKVVNVLADPVVGTILDRGIGRNPKNLIRPFLLLSPLPLSITSILLFVIPARNMAFRIVWVFVFYLIYNVADNFYDISLSAMSVRMCKDPKDRKNFYTLAEFASSLGITLPGGVIPIFISMYSNDFVAQQNIYLIGALVFGIPGLITMLIPGFVLKERNPFVKIKKPKVALNAKALLNNRPLIVIIISDTIESIRKICYGALAFFYLETLNAFWLSTVIGAASVTLTYIGILLVPIIGNKLSSRNMIAFGYLFSTACYALLLVTGYKFLWLVGFLVAISGFPNGIMRSAKKILLADSTEYMEWKTWKKYGTPVRSDAMVFALLSMNSRLNGLWSGLLLPVCMTLIGYVSAQIVDGVTIEVTQSEATKHAIFYLVAVPGVVGNLLPGLIMFLDNYTGKRKEAILAELKELHEARNREQNQVSEVPAETEAAGV